MRLTSPECPHLQKWVSSNVSSDADLTKIHAGSPSCACVREHCPHPFLFFPRLRGDATTKKGRELSWTDDHGARTLLGSWRRRGEHAKHLAKRRPEVAAPVTPATESKQHASSKTPFPGDGVVGRHVERKIRSNSRLAKFHHEVEARSTRFLFLLHSAADVPTSSVRQPAWRLPALPSLVDARPPPRARPESRLESCPAGARAGPKSCPNAMRAHPSGRAVDDAWTPTSTPARRLALSSHPWSPRVPVASEPARFPRSGPGPAVEHGQR